MAFGDLKGTLSGSATSIGTSLAISTGGPVTVAVGDLVYAVLGEQATITSTACADNLGNVYIAASAGADAGATVTGRAWYSRVTVAGSLSTITFTTNGGANNGAGVAAVVEGPFQGIPQQTLDTVNTATASHLSFALGNRRVTVISNYGVVRGKLARSSGKLYCEFTINVGTAQDSIAFGVVNSVFPINAGFVQGTTFVGIDNNSIGWGYLDGSASVYRNGVVQAIIQSFTQGDVACMAVDIGNGRIWFRTNGGNWNNSGTANPATNVGGIDISILGSTLYPVIENDYAVQQDTVTANFGQTAYAQSVPSGFSNWDTLLDTSPADIINDNATPYVCPATGTLSQSQEVVMNFLVHTGNVTLTATSPNTKSVQLNTQTVLTAGIGRQVVSATTSVAPAWTSSGTPTESAYGTTSFKQELAQALTPGLISSDDSFFAPTAALATATPLSYAASDSLYKYRYIPEAGPIGLPFIRLVASGSVLPGIITDSDTFFDPKIVGGSLIAYAGASPLYRFRQISESVVTVVGISSKPLFPGLISDSDTLYVPGLSATHAITPSLISDGDTFSAPTVTASYQLTPGLFTDNDAFSAPVISNNIAPSLLADSDGFFAPSTAASITLLPGVFTDSDTLFVPGLAATNQLTPGIINDSDLLFSMSMAFGFLDPAKITDSDSLFGPAISATKDLTPSLFVESDTLFTPILGIFLSPSLLTDSDLFFAPALTGAGEVLPTLLSDADSFPAPSVVLSAIPYTAYSAAAPLYKYSYQPAAEVFTPRIIRDLFITPGMLTDVDSFFVPALPVSVAPAVVQAEASPLVIRSAFIPPMSVTTVIVITQPQTLFVSTFIDSDLFFLPTISLYVAPSLISDSDAFFSPIESLFITPTLFSDLDAFFAPSVARGSVDISPSPLTDSDVFFSPAVSLAASQAIVVSFVTDADSLKVPTVTVGAVNISPALFTDTDTFFAPVLGLNVLPSLFTDADSFFAPVLQLFITPNLFVDTDTLFVPSLLAGTVNLSPALFVDSGAFFAPVIASAGIQSVAPALLVDADAFYIPLTTVGIATISPALFVDSDVIFNPLLTVNLTPSLLIDIDSVISPIVGPFLSPNRINDPDAFFLPLIATSVNSSLFVDADIFFNPLIFLSGPVGNIRPIMFIDSDVFYGPSIIPGSINIDPSMFVDGRFGLVDSFLEPQLTYNQTVEAGIYNESDVMFMPTVFTRVPPTHTVIEHSLGSDYGIRKSMLRRGRLVIGRR